MLVVITHLWEIKIVTGFFFVLSLMKVDEVKLALHGSVLASLLAVGLL